MSGRVLSVSIGSAEVRQGRVAGAKIVDRQVHPEHRELAQLTGVVVCRYATSVSASRRNAFPEDAGHCQKKGHNQHDWHQQASTQPPTRARESESGRT
ncbi:MAG: hypothetical protein LC797_07735 [Chloroflexi bacterium]|nr:hypothetical protein [Chloroflexota bacterium]